MEKYTVFSLFCGAGGLDLGFMLSGKFDVVFGNDISPHATQTHSRNFRIKHLTSQPEAFDLPAVFQGDISQLELEKFEGLEPDVVSGGPPCQDFSIVGGPPSERSGISVSRGRLYSHFIRALIHLQPRLFVFENVPGLMSTNRGKAYEVILQDFSNLNVRWSEIRKLVSNSSSIIPKGYEIIYSDLVDASRLGVPQSRKRLIIMGVRKDISNSAWWKVNSLKKKVARAMSNNDRIVGKYPLTPIEAFEGRPLPDLEDKYLEVMKDYEGVAEEVNTQKATLWKRNVWKKLNFKAIEDYLVLNQIKPENKEEIDEAFADHAELLKELKYYGVKVSDLVCPDKSNDIPNEFPKVLERMARIPPSENHEFVRGTLWEVEGRGMSLIYRRIHPLEPSYTVVAYGGGGTWGYHYERSRSKLTSRERARLQTFPDEFLFEGNLSQIRAQIGEAVPPLMAKKIAEAIAVVLSELPRK